MALPGGGLAECNGAGDVGGAVDVLASGVHKQQSVAYDGRARFFGGLVVDDGSVGVPAYDCRETLVDTARIGKTELAQTAAQLQLCQLAFRILPLYHHEEPGEGHSVFLHCRGEVGNHRPGLYGFQLGYAGASEYWCAAHMVIDAACRLVRIEKEAGLFRKRRHKSFYIVVSHDLESVLVEVGADFIGYFLRVYEEHPSFFIEIEERYVHRRECDVVGGAQIGDPCYVVERRDEYGVGKLFLDLGVHCLDFLPYGESHYLLVVNEKRVDGAPRAVVIYEIEHREVCVELHPVVAQFLLQTLAPCHRKGHAVDADGLACRCVLCQPVYQVDSVGAVLLHHLEAGSLELVGGLDEVAGVCPAICLAGKHDGCAVGAVGRFKPGDPFAPSPVHGGQFALMGVGA